MTQTPVQSLYSLGSAKWYDPFRLLWNSLVGSRAEQDLLLFLEQNLRSDSRILELGCGTAENIRLLVKHSLPFHSYLGLDFTPDMLNIAREKWKGMSQVTFQEANLYKLPDLSEKFDIILSTWVLSHLNSPSTVVNQAIQKYLVSSGKMFLLFMTKPNWFLHFWFSPLAKYIFQANYVSAQEIQTFEHVVQNRHYIANLVTTIMVER